MRSKKSDATRTKPKAPRGLNKKNTRITAVTTLPTDLSTGEKLKETGQANRNRASTLRSDGPHLSSEAIEQPTTYRELTDKNTLY